VVTDSSIFNGIEHYIVGTMIIDSSSAAALLYFPSLPMAVLEPTNVNSFNFRMVYTKIYFNDLKASYKFVFPDMSLDYLVLSKFTARGTMYAVGHASATFTFNFNQSVF